MEHNEGGGVAFGEITYVGEDKGRKQRFLKERRTRDVSHYGTEIYI